jgi:hypothetical protein
VVALQPGMTPDVRQSESRQACGALLAKTVYWHRDLPPIDSQAMGEHTVEAVSPRIPGTIARRDELWDECQRGLTAEVELRLTQEVARLGGRWAHVLNEQIDTKRDAVTNEIWLHGRYTYVLYR